MKLAEQYLKMSEASKPDKSQIIVLEVERDMVKPFKAELNLTVSISKDKKEAWLEKELSDLKAEFSKQASDDAKEAERRDKPYDASKEEAELNKWIKNFNKKVENEISDELSKILKEGVRVSRDGKLTIPKASSEYPFIEVKLLSGLDVIQGAEDITDWKYSGGEVDIRSEIYSIRR